MDSIHQQVSRAQRRLLMQRFLGILGWVLSASLLVGAAGYGTAKLWVLAVDPGAWFWSWVGGAAVVGLATSLLAAYCTRRSSLEAAIEIDRRFGLQERLSSTLALGDRVSASPAGQALLADASREASRIDVRDAFAIRAPWSLGLPLLPILLVFGLALLVPDASPHASRDAQAATPAAEVIRRETDKLKQQLEQRRAELAEAQAQEIDELLRQLEKNVDELQAKEGLDQKRAMMQVNEMTRMVAEKREQFRGAEEIRKQFSQLKQIQQGPADKLAQALKQGDFRSAQQQLEKLKEQLGSGDMNEEQREELARQLQEMQQKLAEASRAFEDAKRELESQIQQKMQAGDQQGANELQKKLDQLNQMNRQMSLLDQMAAKLGECSQCLQQGDASQAASQLGQLTQSLDDLQQQLSQLQTLDSMLDMLADCKQCLGDGEGSSLASSAMPLDSFDPGSFLSNQQGSGLGPGQGYGERPEDATETGLYDSQVAGQLQKGQSVVTGVADGPNLPGESQIGVREAILSAFRERSDPLADEQIPRDQRDHAKEYFQRFQPASP
jgi:hypothetical protein